ncbi:MAG: 30S ribosomal protein S9 [Candidatus Aenigmarchaeota archaeon]|nr:30S ribosomal protein S9 [Candidatus Aenigmarchaeota archaeon]MBU5688619.1 30S ribosomal protein S9 [Candidatus Aenigmarchaeota archaeon]
MKEKEIIFATGKRKTSVARATLKAGDGKVLINNVPLDIYEPEFGRLRIREVFLLADKTAEKYDIKVNVRGGGISSRVDAIRQAIAKALVEATKSEDLKRRFLEFDRSLLVYDFRRTEPHKPSRSRQGARRHKQRSKR